MNLINRKQGGMLPVQTDSGRRAVKVTVFLAFVVVIASIVSLMEGRVDIPALTVIKILFSDILSLDKTWSPTIGSVIIDVRMPRLLAGLLVGAGLSISGASFQGLFRNPLVSPHILGVAAGSGFGAAFAILLFDDIIVTQIFSFAFGMLAVILTYLLSRVYRSTPVLMMVLSGIIVGALFSALTSFIKYVADPMNKMPAIIFWLLGSLNNVGNKDLKIVAPVISVCTGILLMIRWRINVIAMGDEDARALGVNTELTKAIIIVCATVITAASVCVSGIIGWIGLVIPHIGRILVGPDHRYLLPVSLLAGAGYLVFVDTLARTALVTELPIGILTAIIGAPIFAYLLRKNSSGW